MSEAGKMLLGALISGALQDAATKAERKAPRPLAEDLATLQAASDRFQRGLTFEPGQLVTPRADSGIRDVGRPHIVLDVEPEASTSKGGEVGTSGFGRRLDMRVACTCACDHGEIQAHWVESWMFDPWTPPADAAAPAPAPEAA